MSGFLQWPDMDMNVLPPRGTRPIRKTRRLVCSLVHFLGSRNTHLGDSLLRFFCTRFDELLKRKWEKWCTPLEYTFYSICTIFFVRDRSVSAFAWRPALPNPSLPPQSVLTRHLMSAATSFFAPIATIMRIRCEPTLTNSAVARL
jgi:hypothetical protein